jgi:hypothetical protein
VCFAFRQFSNAIDAIKSTAFAVPGSAVLDSDVGRGKAEKRVSARERVSKAADEEASKTEGAGRTRSALYFDFRLGQSTRTGSESRDHLGPAQLVDQKRA